MPLWSFSYEIPIKTTHFINNYYTIKSDTTIRCRHETCPYIRATNNWE